VNDDGYTLIEVLVALVMVALAMSGLSQGIQVLMRWQTATNDMTSAVQASRRAQEGLERLIGDQGPFRSDKPERLRGDATGFVFDCGKPTLCAVHLGDDGRQLTLALDNGSGAAQTLGLGRKGPAAFSYRGREGAAVTWPPATGGLQPLRSVALNGGGSNGAPILVARLWREQPAACAYDVVMQDCR
jgi:prepilin-type N-terminal cleavage/methylation domain-containing protein